MIQEQRLYLNPCPFETYAHHENDPRPNSYNGYARSRAYRRFSAMQAKSDADQTPISTNDTGMKWHFKLPAWAKNSQNEDDWTVVARHNFEPDGAESHANSHTFQSPATDYGYLPEFRSCFSDDSSCLPQKGLKERLSDLRDKLTTPRPSLRIWATQDLPGDSRRPSELMAERNMDARQLSRVNTTSTGKAEPVKRKPVPKSKDSCRRYSLHERRMTLV